MRMVILLAGAMVAAAVTSSSVLADKAILVLDASGSMWWQIEGGTKIEIAKTTIARLLEEWSPAIELGVIAYGHREKANCADIETLVPVGPVDAGRIKTAIGRLNPKGKTPITAAVRQAAASLRSTEAKATVILVSDGLETCNADPCAAVAELEAAGIDFTVHVIGFGTTDEENSQLQCLADRTGGRFLSAANAAELLAAMSEIKEEVEAPETVLVTPDIGSLSTQGGIAAEVIDGSGTRVGKVCPGCTPLKLSAGPYTLKVNDKIEFAGIEVKGGEETIFDGRPVAGFLSINGSLSADVVDAAGEVVDRLCAGCGPVVLPVGFYTLKGSGFSIDRVEVKPGQMTVIDAR
ncbi:MAG: VWA domain-containing protein [Alphaproteobacteria bacterium]